MEENKITDKSGDKKYYIQVQKIVWAFSRSPYDYTFWCTVKDVCFLDGGECRIPTKDLAEIAMMSTGKACDCRDYFLKIGLLEGNKEKETDNKNAIWNLTVPDLWKKNIELAKSISTSSKMLKYKRKQQIELSKTDSPGESVLNGHKKDDKIVDKLEIKQNVIKSKTDSPGELKTDSPGESTYTPHESPHYIKRKEEGEEQPLPEKFSKSLPSRYVEEWNMWKSERGDEIYRKQFDETPIFTSKDMAAFCLLREKGKTVFEITDRYVIFCRTPNKWYAEKSYAFSLFAECYSSFGSKMQQIKNTATKTNGKPEVKKINPAPASAYFTGENQKQLSQEEIDRENLEIQKTISAMKNKFKSEGSDVGAGISV